jgi:Flp pilus assembly protein TadD
VTVRAAPLTPAQVQRLGEVQRLLGSGRAGEAVPLAQAVAAQAPRAPDAQHALALSLAATGRIADAEIAFRAALELAPAQPMIVTNYARMLRRHARAAEAVALLGGVADAVSPQAPLLAELGLAHLDAGDPRASRVALERALGLAPHDAAAWQALGSACRALHDLDAAEAALRRAEALAPGLAPIQANLGAVLRLRGRPDEALQRYGRAQQLGNTTPALRDARIGALVDLGRPEDALREAIALVRDHPDDVAGHVTLVQLLWEHGSALAPDVAPLDHLRAATRSHPEHRGLQFALARLLIESHQEDQALQTLARLPDDDARGLLEADAFGRLGRIDEADARFRRLLARGALSAPAAINAYARHLLKARRADEVENQARRVLTLRPDDQEAWAYLATAWRLLDDPREHWLCGYDALVALVPVEPFSESQRARQELEATLLPRHRAVHEPMQQSLRGGSQTPGRLFGGDDPVLTSTEAALRHAVARHVERLPDDPAHPFLRRRTRDVRIVGSWSVRLWSAGRHVDHIHPEGWMSSAFYVALPSSVCDPATSDATAGHLQLGRPPLDLGLDLPARRVLRPQPGHLALFPSYVWHGTVPFEDPEPRLTIAFDMQPKG